MPKIGEIKRGRDLGFQDRRHNYQWQACQTCNKGRWVFLRLDEPISLRCKACTGKMRAILKRKKLPFTTEHCRNISLAKKGDKNPMWGRYGILNNAWKGGISKRSDGYVQVLLLPNDFFYPMASKESYVLEHRLVMAKHLNRCLLIWETVHHKNSVRSDNRIENLELLPTPNRHDSLTKMTRYIKKLEREIEILKHGVVEK